MTRTDGSDRSIRLRQCIEQTVDLRTGQTEYRVDLVIDQRLGQGTAARDRSQIEGAILIAEERP